MNAPRRNRPASIAAPVALFSLLSACSTGTAWRIDDGLAAERIEIQVDAGGSIQEIEYISKPMDAPQEVRDAMDELHPGGSATTAEMEYHGSTLYWEMKKSVGGLDVAAMFLLDGTLVVEEIEVPASKVPDQVRSAIDPARWGTIRVWEEVRDGEREVVGYHVKTSDSGRSYKIVVSKGGKLKGAFREIPAEIELPVSLR